MSQNLLLKVSGLYTFPSHLSSVPQGALLKANNIFINRDSIAESRRGFKLYGSAMGSGVSNTAHQLFNYKNRILRHYGSGSGHFLEWDDGSGNFSLFDIILTGTTHSNTSVTGLVSTAQLFVGMPISGSGIPANTIVSSIIDNTSITISNSATSSITTTLTFIYDVEEVIQGLRIKSIEQNGNFYLTTSEGIKKISAASASDFSTTTISDAGGIKALDLKASINSSLGFLSANSVVAYRVVWGINDANNNLILGAPSERVIIRNLTATSVTVDVTITIPRHITTAYFYQIYRTAVFADPTGDQDPGDEMGLVYENNPTISDLNSGSITVHDVTPDSFRGANLYTNANSGEGIAQANDIPPLAQDIATFKGYTFYANTQTKQRLNLSLLSVSSFTSGVSSITLTDGITSNTYTFTTTTLTGDTHNGTTTIDNIGSTASLSPGLSFSNPNVPDGSYIVRIIGPTSIQISAAATASVVGTSIIFATENKSLKQVALSQFPTPSQQVDETARSLVRIINAQAGEIVNAFYVSGPSDLPGLMLFESRKLNQLPVYAIVDNAATTGIEFSPNLPASGNSVISSDEVSPNRIYYSKLQQPEAVPVLNYIDVGPKDKKIIRILGLRDSLFILKEEGVYRLSGLVAPFQVYPFDFSTNIKAPDSAVVLNNLIYIFSNQGITTISDSGVSIISRPIEDSLLPLLTPPYSAFSSASFGISYESDRAYYFFTITNPSDTVATQCFRFNTFTNTWTILNLSKRCGLINIADDRLYLAATDTNKLEQERKNFDRTDLADREISLSISSGSVSKTKITLPSVSNITVGDILVQDQYLTTTDFNRMLTKLDRDSLLSPHNYVSSLSVSSGVNLSDALDNLISKIASDTGRTSIIGSTSSATYLALSPTPTNFIGMQATFNSLVALLNADVGVGYSNYATSSGIIDYELPVLSIDKTNNSITTDLVYPLIAGPVVIYNHIDTELQFVPQQLTDVSITKQASEGTFIFEDSSFTEAIISYSSDLSGDFESIAIKGNGPGTFGDITYGNGVFGGNGDGIPFRTLIPREKQRCRYINANFKHSFAREVFSLYGLSITFNPVSTRGYR